MADEGLSGSSMAFISPISPNVTENHMWEIAGSFGKVEEVNFFSVKTEHGETRIAKIAFESPEAVKSLTSHLDKGEIDGLRVRVTLEEPKVEDLPKMTL